MPDDLRWLLLLIRQCCKGSIRCWGQHAVGGQHWCWTLLLRLTKWGLFLHLDTNAGRSSSLYFEGGRWRCLQLLLLKTACESHNSIYHQSITVRDVAAWHACAPQLVAAMQLQMKRCTANMEHTQGSTARCKLFMLAWRH